MQANPAATYISVGESRARRQTLKTLAAESTKRQTRPAGSK
jgi:hypothetical protein